MVIVKNITMICPIVVAALYAITGLTFAWKREWAWACVWLCYAVANVGLVAAARSVE